MLALGAIHAPAKLQNTHKSLVAEIKNKYKYLFFIYKKMNGLLNSVQGN